MSNNKIIGIMTKRQSQKNTTGKRVLTAGEKFWEEYLATPYSNDRVGQAFVMPWRGRPPGHKKQSSEHKQDENQSTHNTSTHDPGLKFLEDLDRIPYTYDRVGQVSVSSWKGRSFGSRTTEEHPEEIDSSNDQSNNQV